MKKYKPKKSLGQNFLKSAPALRKIIEAGEISPSDTILEIGPGKGALTEKILGKLKTGKLIAVEKDRELFDFLSEKFKKEIAEEKLILKNEDILEFDPKKMECDFFSGPRVALRAQPDRSKKSIPFFYKIIANIPYNITGAILKKFLGGENPSGIALKASQPERMILMVQKEVAERILARDGKESLLSISVKAYGEPKMIMKVPARYFSPAPKVDSAVISIKNISRKLFINNLETVQSSTLHSFYNCEENKFWQIVRSGFAHKRKKVTSNLKKFAPLIKGVGGLETFGNKRAEELTLSDWIELARMI